MWKLVLTLLALAAALPAAAGPAPAASRWLELTARGPELRAVVRNGDCPEASLDGRTVAMQRRGAPSEAFPVEVCQLLVPHGVRRAAIGDWSAPLPRAEPQRILIFGDTGCRLKGAGVQASNVPRQWPFALVSARAAEKKPDLVIHVGDYWYRETPCPAGETGCSTRRPSRRPARPRARRSASAWATPASMCWTAPTPRTPRRPQIW